MIVLARDQELVALIPPLAEKERAQLESNLRAEGCREPLVVWAGEPLVDTTHPCQVPWVYQLALERMIEEASWLCPRCGETRQRPYVLLDGHTRYAICQAHDLPFTIIEAPAWVKTREDAMIWIIQHQFGRRNLESYQRAELALKLEPLIAAKAKAHQQQAGGAVPHKLAEAVDTRETLAKMAGVSHETMRKAKAIAQKADEPTKESLRRGERSIHRVYQTLHRPRVASNGKSTAWASSAAPTQTTSPPMEPDPQVCMAERLIDLASTMRQELVTWREQFPQATWVQSFLRMESDLGKMEAYLRDIQRRAREAHQQRMAVLAESVEVPVLGTTGP
jgi:hypothetical protein